MDHPEPAGRRRQLPAVSRWLRWLSRAFFAAALASLAAGFWLRERPPAQPAERPYRPSSTGVEGSTARINWVQEEFLRWESSEDGLSLSYPARFDAVRGFGRFTSRDLQDGLVQQDAVAFRASAPRAVIAVSTYRAESPLSWVGWQRLARRPTPRLEGPPPEPPRGPLELNIGRKLPPSPLSSEFGGTDLEYTPARIGTLPALAVQARGAVRYPLRSNETIELWRFESRFAAQGDRAVRITFGVHADHYEATLPAIRRVLASFRWDPQAPQGTPATRP